MKRPAKSPSPKTTTQAEPDSKKPTPDEIMKGTVDAIYNNEIALPALKLRLADTLFFYNDSDGVIRSRLFKTKAEEQNFSDAMGCEISLFANLVVAKIYGRNTKGVYKNYPSSQLKNHHPGDEDVTPQNRVDFYIDMMKSYYRQTDDALKHLKWKGSCAPHLMGGGAVYLKESDPCIGRGNTFALSETLRAIEVEAERFVEKHYPKCAGKLVD